MMTDFQRAAAQRPDYSTKDGAEKLKAKIEAHWARVGLPAPFVEAVRVAGDYRSNHGDLMRERYELRSDMVNALPKGARP